MYETLLETESPEISSLNQSMAAMSLKQSNHISLTLGQNQSLLASQAHWAQHLPSQQKSINNLFTGDDSMAFSKISGNSMAQSQVWSVTSGQIKENVYGSQMGPSKQMMNPYSQSQLSQSSYMQSPQNPYSHHYPQNFMPSYQPPHFGQSSFNQIPYREAFQVQTPQYNYNEDYEHEDYEKASTYDDSIYGNGVDHDEEGYSESKMKKEKKEKK